ncbi:MAG: hypothetical protein LBS49_11900 [Candidatus Accumulibacter sp.]|nr:hypothetical protein [Accumulibacter sp.]
MPLPEHSGIPFAQEEFAAWKKGFREAERCLKRLEDETEDGLDITAVNQLRYVAFHLFAALCASEEGDENKKKEEGRKLKAHLDRAIYDACDGLVQFYLEQIKSFQEDYRSVVITDVLSKYFGLLRSADDAHELINQARAGKGERRGEFSGSVMTASETLKCVCAELVYAREELNKKIRAQKEEKEEKRRTTKQWCWGIALAVITILIGLVSFYK